MRVTSGRMIDLAAAATSKGQESVATAAAEVSSGMRVQKPSDDPSAWLAAQRAQLRSALVQGSSSAVATSRDRLTDTDNALASIGDAVAQIRELAVQGASGSYNASDRAELAAQVRSLFAAATAAANTRTVDGEYVLAGSASLAAPFSATGAYQGDAAARDVPTADVGTTVATIAGSDLTASRGVDVMPLFGRLATALAANDQQAVHDLLGDLDTAVKQVGLARTRVGGAMNVLDATVASHSQLQQTLATNISRSVEADSIASASALAKASQSLEASRTVTAHVIALLDPNR